MKMGENQKISLKDKVRYVTMSMLIQESQQQLEQQQKEQQQRIEQQSSTTSGSLPRFETISTSKGSSAVNNVNNGGLSTFLTNEKKDPMLSAARFDTTQHQQQQQVPSLSSPNNVLSPKKKETLNLLGCFSATMGTTNGTSHHFVINVFDKGCLLTPGETTWGDLLCHLRTPRGTSFEAVYSKIDPIRSTCDRVDINIFQSWVSVSKPGLAARVLANISEAKFSFFLQTSALNKVEIYFATLCGLPWIRSVKLVTNVNAESAKFNEDFVMLATKTSLPYSNTTTIIQDNNRALGLPTHPLPLNQPPSSDQPQHMPLQPPLNASLKLTGRQYAALSEEQELQCTTCRTCRKRFKYVMEHLFHFTMSMPCRSSILNNSNSSVEMKNSNNPKSFYSLLAETIAKRCNVESQQAFVCDVCLVELRGPMQYGMHRDQHRPVQNEVNLCQFCSYLFTTPFVSIRHDCIKRWDVKQTIRLFSHLTNFDEDDLPNHGIPQAASEDAFKIYSRISDEEKNAILRCPVCSKQNVYISGLLSHFRSSESCFSKMKQMVHQHESAIVGDVASKSSDEVVKWSSVIFQNAGILPRPVKCEICSLESTNQLGYAIHRDHHSLKKQGMLICKGCNKEFKAPCEFYRHCCSNPRLHWCPFCDVSRHCDIARETARIRARQSPIQSFPPIHPMSPNGNDTTTQKHALTNGHSPKTLISSKSGTLAPSASKPQGKKRGRPKKVKDPPNSTNEVEKVNVMTQQNPDESIDIKFEAIETTTDVPLNESIVKKSPEKRKKIHVAAENIPASSDLISQITPSNHKEVNGSEKIDVIEMVQHSKVNNKKKKKKKKRKKEKEFVLAKEPLVNAQDATNVTMANRNSLKIVLKTQEREKKISSFTSNVVGNAQEDSPDVQVIENPLSNVEQRLPECFICMDCDPLRIIRDPESLAAHSKLHLNINPVSKYNKLTVKLGDIKKTDKYKVILEEEKKLVCNRLL